LNIQAAHGKMALTPELDVSSSPIAGTKLKQSNTGKETPETSSNSQQL